MQKLDKNVLVLVNLKLKNSNFATIKIQML